MLSAIPRYGARVIPNTEQTIAQCRNRGELVEGPHRAAFEEAFARAAGGDRAIATSYGRMAFYYILKALRLPPESEVILPALTFWVIPELARVAGLRPVFADVDPRTFTLDPAAVERVLTPRTSAIVPTHLYGLACDMDPLMDLARRHGLAVVEDCAHALGATYRGRPVGTFGEAALFSFQTLKPLNTYGGGAALVNDPVLAKRVADIAASEPAPQARDVERRLRLGRLQRIFIRPGVFTISAFPILWTASWFDWNPDVFLWEEIRPLDPLPSGYRQRYSNVQAAIGLEALKHLDRWTSDTREHARTIDRVLSGLPGVETPVEPTDRRHVYYQYCIYVPDRDGLVCRAIRHGIDLETLHVDLCTAMDLFPGPHMPTPGGERAISTVQVPVYASLTSNEVARVASSVRSTLERALPTGTVRISSSPRRSS
jgi:dTDP-4-amino-4,6-dideoxygalactose transaminase